MSKQVLVEQFERRLVELGYPARKLRRKVAELDLHHDNLKRTALQEDMPEAAAVFQADHQFGNPVALAEEAAAAQRQGSWWGRHPILGFIVLPILSLGPAVVAGFALMALVIYTRFTQEQLNAYGSSIGSSTSFKDFKHLVKAMFDLHYIVLTLWPMPFCWLARRSASGLKWQVVPCVICALQGMFFQLNLNSRNFQPGYYFWSPQWLGALGPLLIAGEAWLRQALALRRLAPLPENVRSRGASLSALKLKLMLNAPLGSLRPAGLSGAKAFPTVREDWLRKAVRTPTYWVVAVVLVVAVCLALINRSDSKRRAKARPAAQSTAPANNADLKGSVWPAERETALRQIKARQAAKETKNETVINLQPQINVQLEESVDGAKDLKDNDLRELPRGVNIYGGVPFDVEGRIQLMGQGLEQWKRVFPITVKNIEIGRKCARIHLFHGENCNMLAQIRGPVAKLVLHYADDSEATIQIVSGRDLLDWWGPIYTSGVPANRRVLKSTTSELAWVGQNPWIHLHQPDCSLRLYKSTFENPRPDTEIASIKYVSSMTQAAPFMLGMTVE